MAKEALDHMGLPNDADGVARLAGELRADFCFFSCSGPQAVPHRPEALREAVAAAYSRDLACGAVVDGPWQRLTCQYGLYKALMALRTRQNEIQQELAVQAVLVHEEIRAWASAGADLCLLADDLAYTGGLYFSPEIFGRFFHPLYAQFTATAAGVHIPLGFHSDGHLTPLLPSLVEIGFGFFSLEPEVMDLNEAQASHANRIGLVSGIPAVWLNPERLAEIPPEVIRSNITSLACHGPVMLASSCGVSDAAGLAALRQVYRIADGLT